MSSENNKAIDELKFVKGIGPKRAEALVNFGINSIEELLYHIPFRYLDRRHICQIINIRQQVDQIQEITIFGKIVHKLIINSKFTKRLILTIQDESSQVECVWFGGTSYFDKIFEVGESIAISGNPTFYGNKIQFVHPDYDKITDEDDKNLLNTGALIPMYHSAEELKRVGLDSRGFRRIIKNSLTHKFDIRENLSVNILRENHFLPLKDALINIHFPKSDIVLEKALYRLKFNELFFFQLLVALKRKKIKIEEKCISYNIKSTYARKLVDSLQFKLTKAQKRVIKEITDDMKSNRSMNRLLQGDVGSGKTIVALLSILIAIESGYQTALMVPTEILCEQHYNNIKNFLKDFPINIRLLIGGQKKKLRQEILTEIEDGTANLVIGTHAIIEDNVKFKNLGLIVIDEQHRFGVMQRATLRQKGYNADVLVMTATPIPRTLSLTLYGDLDVSILDELPANRKPIQTYLVDDDDIRKVYDFIRKKVLSGNQVYIVYPLIEESEKLDLKAATEGYEHLKNEIFPEFKIGLIHSKLFSYEKDSIMNDLKNGAINILVATTVIEVGIDVPNANIMVIQNSERFGLSQLHQLRGRVGRGADQSYCFLISKKYLIGKTKKNYSSEEQEKMQTAAKRLKTMIDTTDGFKIAEVDLKLRGPGEFFGTKQTGLPSFQIANLITDSAIIEVARKVSFELIEDDPKLERSENGSIKNYFTKYYRNSIDLSQVG